MVRNREFHVSPVDVCGETQPGDTGGAWLEGLAADSEAPRMRVGGDPDASCTATFVVAKRNGDRVDLRAAAS